MTDDRSEQEPSMEDILELTNDMLVKEKKDPVMESISSMQSRLQPDLRQEEGKLVSSSTATISAATLGELARVVRECNLTLGHGDVTLETIVRETLRPLLKAWLDEYLPSTIERIVTREIERLIHQIEDGKL